jgi:alkylhydroperoxidase family enzyme
MESLYLEGSAQGSFTVTQCRERVMAMDSKLELRSGLERIVVRLLATMCRALWGFAPRMLPHIVRTLGPGRALAWFAANFPRYLWSMRALGPLRTHLAAVAISLHNSCTYCAYGHAYALELIYLRDHGRLFPVDATTIASWRDLGSRELAHRLRRTLQEAGLHVEALWVDRTLALAAGSQRPVDRDEARLAHMVAMIGRMNRVAVAAGVQPDEAQNPVNKDVALKQRHTLLRAAGA